MYIKVMYLKGLGLIGEFTEPYQNNHHQLMVASCAQESKACWLGPGI